MKSDLLPPLVKTAERLLLEVEKSVRSFSRFNKYQHGAVLRSQAMLLARTAHRAWREWDRRLVVMQELSDAIDDFKLTLQLSSQLRAFSSGGQFSVVAELANDVGKQCGGWIKQQHRKRQDAPSREAIAQRPQTLSSRPASIFEAHP